MGKKTIKTKKEDIIGYWQSRICESNLSVDWSEAHERCWRCGYKSKLERCHIIPASLAGEDAPSNFVLLCKRCHIENPNVSNPKIMWDWLKAYKTPFYDTYWIIRAVEEYKRIYRVEWEEEFENILKCMTELDDSKEDFDNFNKEFRKEFREIFIKQTSYHYGHPNLNSATLAGVLRISIEEFSNKYNIKLSDNN